MRKNKLGQANSLLFTLFNVIKRWNRNEEILNIGLKCLVSITVVERPKTEGFQNILDYLIELASSNISKSDTKFQIFDEIKVNSLRIISNFQP